MAGAMRGALAVAVLLAGGGAALAQFADPGHFSEKDGAALYSNICQGCHMADGRGAVGAGTYPALAGDDKLASAGYPIAIVVNGQKGMPGFAAMLSDDQIAEVVTYVRTHFGNHYTDAVSAGDVAPARQ